MVNKDNIFKQPLENWIKIVGAAIAIGTVIIGSIQYFSNVKNEFQRTFWFEQLSLYKQVCSAAATISISSDIDSVRQERKTFWTLYWGTLSILEHPEVKDAMVEYGSQLSEVEQRNYEPRTLKMLSFKLARACRLSLSKTWNPVDIGDLNDVKKTEHEKPVP